MKTLLTFLKTNKKICFAVLSVVLALLFVSLLTVNARQALLSTHTVDRDTLCTDTHAGYETKIDEEGVLWLIPSGDDPQLYVPMGDGLTFNKVTIRFAKPAEEPVHVQLYYADNGGGLAEKHSYHATLNKGEDFVSVFLPERNYTTFRIDMNGQVAPASLLLESVLRERYYTVNWLTLILFVVIVTLLAVFNRRIGYFTFVKEFFLTRIATYKEVRDTSGRGKAILYAVMWIAIAVYVSALTIFLLLSHTSVLAIYVMFALAAVAVLLRILWVCVSGRGAEPAKLFLIVAILVGFLFAYCLPITSGVSWDDQIHYQRADNISRLLFGHKSNLADYDQAIFLFLASANFEDFDGVNMNILVDSQIPTGQGGGLVNFYTHISYFHMALIIAFNDWFGIDFILQMILIKMANVLIYASVLYFGIRKLKSGAYLMSVICLLPTALFMASTMTYDWWVTAFLGYAAATYVSELQSPERPITWQTTVKMLAAILVGCGPKAVYFVLFFPILFLGKHKFTSKKHRRGYVLACLLVLAIIFLSFVLPFFVNVGSQTDTRGGEDVNSGEQLAYILSNPLEYASTLLWFLADYTSFSLAAQHCSFYAYLQNPSPVIPTALLMILLLCVFTDKRECDIYPGVWRHRILTYLSCFATLCVVATALYIAFTPVGYNWVNGCQWRYIIPVLFPFFSCVGTPKIKNGMAAHQMSGIVFGVLAVALLASFFHVYVLMF